VPASIAEEEILPVAQADPTYLARNNYEMIDGRIRQKPGPGNALGRFKFLFPNDDDIYLHDTPADHLFSQSTRAFSHGCIRIEQPRELAELLLERYTDRSPASIDGMLASGSERWVALRDKLPVYIMYFTAWADEDGTTRFHRDIYGHDEGLKPSGQIAAR
jgi:murein L,D-transpeptidase YcbB/YkuD